MHINFDTEFEISLISILDFIALDKVSAAISFHKELYRTFDLIKENPYMFKASRYFKMDSYRDMIHKGYTVIYRVDEEEIFVLEIFKWTDR